MAGAAIAAAVGWGHVVLKGVWRTRRTKGAAESSPIRCVKQTPTEGARRTYDGSGKRWGCDLLHHPLARLRSGDDARLGGRALAGESVISA
jgi:hypothetical protein